MSLLRLVGYFAVIGFAIGGESSACEPALPTRIDLSSQFDQWEIPCRSQGNRPTCSVCTIVGALEFTRAKHGQTTGHLSIEYANWAKNQAAAASTDGGFFHSIWRGIRRHGLCDENLYPYKEKFDATAEPNEATRKNAAKFHNIPINIRWIKRWNPNTGLENAQFLEIKKALQTGYPVCVGLRWPHKAVRENGILLSIPQNGVYDGHSILFIGYQDDDQAEGGGYFSFRNTNSPGANEKMSYRYVLDYANDALFFPLLSDNVLRDVPFTYDLEGYLVFTAQAGIQM